jgi:hypothetical protein
MTTISAELAGFLAGISALERGQLVGVLNTIADRDARPSADTSWWEATIQIESCLRAEHRTQQAAAAAHRAADVLRMTAERRGFGPPGADHTRRLARSAGEAARALVAQGSDATGRSFLVAPWTTAIDELTASSSVLGVAA